MPYILLTIAVLLQAMDFVLCKLYQKLVGADSLSVLRFNALLGLCTFIVFWILNGFRLSISPYSLGMAALISGFAILYTLIGFKLLRQGSVAYYTLFLMTGGMLLPYLFGLFFLNEPFRWIRMAGVVIILAGVILANFDAKKLDVRQVGMCLAIFLLNGMVSIVSKLHQTDLGPACVNAQEFVMWSGCFKFLFAGSLFLILSRRPRTVKAAPNASAKRHTLAAMLIIAVASAAVSGLSYLLQLVSASSLPATVLYPFVTGGSIAFSAVAGWLIFREKLTAKMGISILCCFAGTLLFL